MKKAEKYLERWLGWAICSRLEQTRGFTRMIKMRRKLILNYLRVPVTNTTFKGVSFKAREVG